jgi:hypothetical protein
MTGFCFGRSLGFRVSALGFLSSYLDLFFFRLHSLYLSLFCSLVIIFCLVNPGTPLLQQSMLSLIRGLEKQGWKKSAIYFK